MQMKINGNIVKQKRLAKLWSQEELAIASGLGLRTIQRVESTDSASFETLKSLASALELSTEELTLGIKESSNYFNVQLGYTILSVLLIAFSLCVWQFSKGQMEASAFIAIALTLCVVSLLFGTMSVMVSKEKLTWYFGIGFWTKKLNLAVIQDARPVKNKGWWGWGIRYYGGGWLYNVSGLGAVELTLIDGKRLRIGSDEPDQLAQFLNSKLDT